MVVITRPGHKEGFHCNNTIGFSDSWEKYQGHPTDCFGRISVRKTCNRLKFSVREMSSRAFLIKIN